MALPAGSEGAFSSSTVFCGSTSARPAGRRQLIEVRDLPFADQHHAWQRARILVDVGILGAGDEIEIAGLERRVDPLDRHAGRDQPHAEQIGEGRAPRRIERRERPLADRRHRVADARRVIEPLQPQWIVAEHLLAAVDQAHVGPVIFDADRLDAVAMVRLLLRKALLDQRDRFVLRAGAQHVVARGRQAGRFMRRVVPGEIGGREHDEQQASR